MTARRPARKPATAGVSALEKLDQSARTHPYRTVEERIARGLAWRETAPVEAHAAYGINRRRKSPVGILRAQDNARVKELVPIRYGRIPVPGRA